MSESLPNCPKCDSHYVYEDQALLICPECGHEWNPNEVVGSDEDTLDIKDANGQPLAEGDKDIILELAFTILCVSAHVSAS